MSDIIEFLQSRTVTFCVDTNVLVEFLSLAHLPWRELAPHADQVQIVVPSKVAEEMDAHKKKSGRLRRVGIEFSKLSRQIEDAVTLVVHNESPTITVEFGPIFRRSELDGDLFDLDDPDGRIVAEFAAIASARPGSVLLADDSKPIRLARAAGLPCIRPPPSWRRVEGPDERDQTISDLRREIGALPNLVARFSGAENVGDKITVSSLPDHEFCTNCTSALIRAALSVDRMVPREASIMKFGLSAGGFSFPGLPGFGISKEDLAVYEGDYREFVNNVSRWAGLVPSMVSGGGAMQPITVEVANEGDRTAERVHAEVEVSGDFKILPFDLYESQFQEYLEPPSPPRPALDPLGLPGVDLLRSAAQRVDLFHEQVAPSRDGSCGRISWRCEEFRHGTTHRLPLLVAAKLKDAKGLLTVHLSAAQLAKATVVRAPLVATKASSSEPLCRYIANRTAVLPAKYKLAIDSIFAGLEDCPHHNIVDENPTKQ